MSKKFLIIEARFYEDILDCLVQGAVQMLEMNNFEYERLEVPGALEIPAAVSMAAKTDTYAGFVALGCVIRGETSHYETVSNESARGLMQLAIEHHLAIGNGIITVESREQALARANVADKNKGAAAALAAVKMFFIKQRYTQ